MESFDLFFGLNIGHKLLTITDNLSISLQNQKMSAISGQKQARLTIRTVEKMRTEEIFNLIFDFVQKKASEPEIGRKTASPNYSTFEYLDGCESSSSDDQHQQAPKEKYCQSYYEIIDLSINCHKERFESKTFETSAMMENVLITAINGKEVCDKG